MIIGILGGGQLARMLALAGHPLGFRFIFYDPAADVCAAPLGEHLQAEWGEREALRRFAERADVVTYEFENVPADAVEWLSERVPVHPRPEALAAAQDRLREKTLFRKLGIATPDFRAIETANDLRRVPQTGSSRLKTRTQGYDGKGQVALAPGDDVEAAWLAVRNVPSIVEQHVDFAREVSIVAVRAASGEIAFYPIAENVHRGGILRTSISRPDDRVASTARAYVTHLLEHLDYVGVVALELFEDQDGTLLANEFAPRVHNSGHWTIEGAETSQFENHLRAVTGLPLGSTDPLLFAGMVNCIGTLPDAAQLLQHPNTHFHDYGKAPREGRKLGHVTVRDADREAVEARVRELDESFSGG